MMVELLPVIDRSARGCVQVAGLVARNIAHTRGVPHGSVLVAVVIGRLTRNGTEPCVVLQKRPACADISPGLWDILGGHLVADKAMLPDRPLCVNESYVERLFDETALREVNEECTVGAANGLNRWRFDRQHVVRFGQIGGFEHGLNDSQSLNREYSTFYGAFVPQNVLLLSTGASERSIRTQEHPSTAEANTVVDTESTCLSMTELASRFARAPEAFADGIGRVLSRTMRERHFMQALDNFFRMGLLIFAKVK